MALPSLRYSEPGPSSAGHQPFPTQAGAPRLRQSRATMLPHSSFSSPSSSRSRDSSRPRYSSSSDSFSDEFYHPSRRASRWRTLAAAPAGLYKASMARFGRRRGPALLCFCCLALLLSTYVLHRRFVSAEKAWPLLSVKQKVVVFGRDEVRKIWEWEVRSGHHPSTRPIPAELEFTAPPRNPALPYSARAPWHSEGFVRYTLGTGAQRIYPDVRTRPPDYGHPPRPIPGSIADFDKILEQCDYDTGKYIRDCHEFMRLGAGLDHNVRLRREDIEDLRYVYVLDGEGDHIAPRAEAAAPSTDSTLILTTHDNWTRALTLPPPPQQPSEHHRAAACSEDEPRVFHMFWAGPITDKPYMAIMAFLYTQNLGLHLETPPTEPPYCRPQLWIWIGRGAADAPATANAEQEMLSELRANPWASPFFHERLRDVIKFRLWDTTSQLDSIPELKDDWRKFGNNLLRSQGKAPTDDLSKKVGSIVSLDGNTEEDFMSYNKIPVILSDLVRFVLCHRYGGVYLDVDMLLLRDWEELWNYPGAFSYRWSHENYFNTAVLRLRRGSALGTFLLRSALAHGLDFHPKSVTGYLRDAHMEELLFRLPDALFDPAWQNCDFIKTGLWGTKKFLQHDRPPQPFITDFDQFFNTPPQMSAMPSVIGFDGFFRGAYIYHYHNEWWKPFDRARYWPDLGTRFAESERMGREAIANENVTFPVGFIQNDERDLTWATVMKRTFEAYIRGERPNMYGEWIRW